jgi:hypothetical protein
LVNGRPIQASVSSRCGSSRSLSRDNWTVLGDEKQPLPESRIRGAKVESGEGPVPLVKLILDPAGGDGTTAIDFRATDVAVALIKFCRLKRIPLPKRAEKSLGVDQGQISLVLRLASH